jgi:peptidoglycan/LPS O-acetylase OafA/YrhL
MKFQNPSAMPAVGATILADGYSPFIDGLRAISILAVVGFHVGIPGFSGGFVGVDVFFAISGYLIITQIDAKIENGSFSLANFWSRRALRILPPFALVVAASITVGMWVLVMPDEIADFSNSALYACAMIANYFFYWQQGYFDTAAHLKPLLHTWTLSVEEQFYVVVPLLLIGLFWIRDVAKSQGIVLGTAVAVFAVSLIACITYTSPTQNAAFFLMPYRAWEFVAGGLVTALIPLARRLSDKWCELAAALGMSAIIVPISGYSEHLQYPSYYAAIPVVGGVALIAVGIVRPQVAAVRLLATPPLVAIGLISYSWYLWHWPLLSFARIYDFGRYQTEANALALAISFFLAATTYLLIERPLKRLRRFSGVHLWLCGSAAALALGAVGSLGYVTSPIIARRSQAEWIASGLPEPIRSWWTRGEPCSLENLPITELDPRCANQPWIKSFGFLMGDSHAMTAFGTYQEEARRRGIQLITRVDGSCLPLLHTRSTNQGVPMTSCQDGMREATAMLSATLPAPLPFVILKASWTGINIFPISRDPPVLGEPDDMLSILTDRLRVTINSFKEMGVQRILVIGPEPMFNFNVSNCLFRARQYGKNDSTCATPRSAVEAYERPTISAISEATSEYDNVRLIDVVDALCSGLLCPASKDSRSLYVDNSHMTRDAERILFDKHKADFDWIFGDQSPTDAQTRPLPR